MLLAFNNDINDFYSAMDVLRNLAKKGHVQSRFVVAIFNFAVNMYSANVEVSNLAYAEGLKYFIGVRNAKQVANSRSAVKRLFIFCWYRHNEFFDPSSYLCSSTPYPNPWNIREDVFDFV